MVYIYKIVRCPLAGFIFIGGVTFYPASGLRMHTSGAFNVTGSYGFALSCALSGVNASSLGFWSAVYPLNLAGRAFGLSVRCVQYLLLLKL
jgi:hypothetical protein